MADQRDPGRTWLLSELSRLAEGLRAAGVPYDDDTLTVDQALAEIARLNAMIAQARVDTVERITATVRSQVVAGVVPPLQAGSVPRAAAIADWLIGIVRESTYSECAGEQLEVTTAEEYCVWWHAGDSLGIVLSQYQISHRAEADRIGASRIGKYGITRYSLLVCTHRRYADGSTWIGPWREVPDGI